jgi:amino acid transporter
MQESKPLRRSLSFPMMVLYGLGTTIGAGIYALVGELAGIAGYYAPLSFFIASLLAGFTALSFAELSGRFPRAAGAALYVEQGLQVKSFSTLVGLLVALAGMVSSAALINAFIGYFHEFFPLDRWIIIVSLCLILGGLAAWGISQSVLVVSIFTLIEIGGLVLIIYLGSGELAELPKHTDKLIPSFSTNDTTWIAWGAVFSGALLAFYAYIGFEDMVDVAEEVIQVRKTLPYAILTTLLITTLLYLLVMLVSVFAMPPDQLAKSKAPLATVFTQYTGKNAYVISIIGLFAIINGALIQIIMASRVLYGLGSRGHLPVIFSKVNSKTRTPLIATFLVTTLVLTLAMLGKLAGLAKTTSIIMLTVFAIVNLALWILKLRERKTGHAQSRQGAITVPFWFPLLGFLVCSGFVIKELAAVITG